jgi:hypothetical protein
VARDANKENVKKVTRNRRKKERIEGGEEYTWREKRRRDIRRDRQEEAEKGKNK